MSDVLNLSARLVHAAMWDQAGGEMPTSEDLDGLCTLLLEAGVFLRGQYDRERAIELAREEVRQKHLKAIDTGAIPCPCSKCLDARGANKPRQWMVLCPMCGNKRCPHAANHENTCTNSNESGQPGSNY